MLEGIEDRERIRDANERRYRDYLRRYTRTHREEVKARQRRYAERLRAFIQEKLGTVCYLCGSSEKVKYHELSGRPHTVTLSYIVKHIEDFVPLCWDCHGYLHRRYRTVDLERMKSLTVSLSNSSTLLRVHGNRVLL